MIYDQKNDLTGIITDETSLAGESLIENDGETTGTTAVNAGKLKRNYSTGKAVLSEDGTLRRSVTVIIVPWPGALAIANVPPCA